MIFNNHYYLGMEAFVSADTTDVTHRSVKKTINPEANNTSPMLNAQINIKYSYGVSLLPGVMIAPNTMLYGRIGWIGSQFSLLYLESDIISPAVINLENRRNGIQLGLGIETKVSDHVSIRGEYNWAKYCKSIKAKRTSMTTDSDDTIYNTNITLKINKPEVSTFGLAAIYHFVS